jgi:hypothetical protein
LDNLTSAAPESTNSISQAVRYPDSDLLDELCRRAKELDAVSIRIRDAIERNRLDSLGSLHEEFDILRDGIIAEVYRLAAHRLRRQT